MADNGFNVAPHHLPLAGLAPAVRRSLLTPIEPAAPIGLVALGSIGPELLVKVDVGHCDLVDGHTFRERWELEEVALDLRHGGTAVAVAAEVVRLRGPKDATAQQAMALAMRVACEPPEQRAGWAAKLVTIARAELAPRSP